MYNPDGNDNNKEFIEIYSDEINNFSGYIIEDDSSNDILEQVKYFQSDYSLIVEEDFDYSSINASIYIIGATIGNNLNNEDDIIILRNNESKILDVFIYFDDLGGNDNGKSLERISLDEYTADLSNWKESILIGGTPGKNNSVIEINFNDIIITEFLPNPKGQDDANPPDGEWIEIYNNKNEDVNLNGFKLKDDANHELILSNTNADELTLKSKSYKIIYLSSISGFLNNDNLDKIRLYYGNKLIDEVSYTNSKEEYSWGKLKNTWKILTPTPGEENFDDSESRLISFIKIEKVYSGNDNKLTFGDNFEVRLRIYKGDTNKNAIDVWVENENSRISKVTNFNIYNKFENYTLNIPLILDSNCNEKYKDGNYKIKVHGFDQEDEEEINVEGIDERLCNVERIIETKESRTVSQFASEPFSEEEKVHSEEPNKNEVQSKIIYQSSDLKAKNSGVYFLISTLIIIIVFILFRKDL